MRKLCIVRRGRRKDFDHCDRLVSIRTFNAHKRRKTFDTEKLVSQCDFEWLLFAFVWSAFQTVCRCFITFILRNNILICSCLILFLILDYTDELLSQDLRIHSDSSDLDLDFDLSSDECSEVAKFAAESPELQGIYSYIYLHQTLMLFTFRINLLWKQSLGEIEVLRAWS